MKTFLGEVAAELYGQYGEELADLTVVFPNRRGSRFFSRELSRLITRPAWQPQYSSIDDLLKQYTGLEPAHILTLVGQLWSVYRRHLPDTESDFDSFFSWGRLIISDFDTIDKYMIDARKLYSNIDDLEKLDSLLGDDFAEKELILNFWRSIKGRSKHSETFLNIWDKLADIYDEFTATLKSKGIGYSGMIYRSAAVAIAQSDSKRLEGQYVFVGFNALNRCEQVILEVLKREDQATFFWDADKYYVDNRAQEAGLFLRQNIEKFGDGYVAPRNFVRPKNISVVKSPSEVMQCKALYSFLEDLHRDQGGVDSETAIVLTDEALLPVVLYSIPPVIKDINITMGSPLSQSAPYVFLDRLSSLQRNRREGCYYYEDLLSVLAHPYLRHVAQGEVERVSKEITTAQYIYVPKELMDNESELLKLLFPLEELSVAEYSRYYGACIDRFAVSYDDDDLSKQNNEYAMALAENIRRIDAVIKECGIDVSIGIYHSLLGQMNALTRLPFEGHPLKGLQIMGILESRCLDFKNVFVLSMCDDTFPGNRMTQSYIPPNLRKGFGLPSNTEHAAMWAYYFYRLIQRAQNVTLMYSTSRDGMNSSGEQSRYIYQLEYESPHEVQHVGVDLHITPHTSSKPIRITKEPHILDSLRGMVFSPTGVNMYIDCPLQFYFHYIAKMRVDEEPENEISQADSGSILHKTIERLYKPIIGKNITDSMLREISSSDDVIDAAIDDAAREVLGGRLESGLIQGNMEHLRLLLHNQVANIIAYDSSSADLLRVVALEQSASTLFDVDGQRVKIAGYIDRVDALTSGVTRVVDYKSGTVDLRFNGMESLFTNQNIDSDEQKYAPHNSAVLQTLIYAMGIKNSTAAIFPLKMIEKEGFSPYPLNKQTGELLDAFSDQVREEFRGHLVTLFREIFDPQRQFSQAPFDESCKYCPYANLCSRGIDAVSEEEEGGAEISSQEPIAGQE